MSTEATAIATTSSGMEHYYNDGDEIKVTWQVGFVILAYLVSFLGSYSAIRVLERGLWRTEQEAKNATCKLLPVFNKDTCKEAHLILAHVTCCVDFSPVEASEVQHGICVGVLRHLEHAFRRNAGGSTGER
jgi:hypothetical protein